MSLSISCLGPLVGWVSFSLVEMMTGAYDMRKEWGSLLLIGRRYLLGTGRRLLFLGGPSVMYSLVLFYSIGSSYPFCASSLHTSAFFLTKE